MIFLLSRSHSCIKCKYLICTANPKYLNILNTKIRWMPINQTPLNNDERTIHALINNLISVRLKVEVNLISLFINLSLLILISSEI